MASKSPVPEGKFAKLPSGYRMHYHEAGTGDPVMFLHGSGPGASGWSNFKGNYPYFAEHGLRTLVPDSLGFGYSDKPEDEKYTMEFHVAAYKGFLDELGIDKLSLVGNSHGGAIAISFALQYPERIEKLVLMAPGGLEEREVYMQMAGIQAMMKSFFNPEGLSREGMRKVFGLQLYDASLVTDEIIEERFTIAETQPQCVIATQRVPNLTDRLKDLQCPVFALWGMNDQFCPPSGAKHLADNCKRCRVMTLSECGHWVMVEYRDLFNRLSVDFLKE